MGCHTWFYRKLNVEEEEILPAVIELFEDNIKFWNNYLYDKNSLGDYLEVIQETYPEIDDEYAKKSITICERKIRMITNGLCKEAVRNKYCESLKSVTRYMTGKGFFISQGTTHDVFRKYGYPEDTLFSYEETINYIEDIKNECHLYITLEETKEKLKNFWDMHPDGMIDFG